MTNGLHPLEGKRVIVTGNTGFKGAWLTVWLNQIGAQVFGFAKDIPFSPSFFEAAKLEELQIHRWGDICDISEIVKAFNDFKPEVVFHLAAQPLVRRSYDQPVETFHTNVLGTVHVAEAIRQTPSVKSVVIITTDKVYRNLEQQDGYVESDRLGGYDPYSGSKAASELAIESYFLSYFRHRPGFSMTIARAGNVIGGGDFSEDRLIPDAVRAWMEGRPVIVRNPDSIRPWQHVLEPLFGYLKLAAAGLLVPEKVTGQAFNFGPRIETGGTVREIVEIFRKRWKGFQFEIAPQEVGIKKETTLLRLNYSKAENLLGWTPRLDITQALQWTAETYEDYVNNPEKILETMKEQITRYESKIG